MVQKKMRIMTDALYDLCLIWCLVYGKARVYDSAKVFGDAEVYGRARVYGDSLVEGDAELSSGDYDSVEISDEWDEDNDSDSDYYDV